MKRHFNNAFEKDGESTYFTMYVCFSGLSPLKTTVRNKTYLLQLRKSYFAYHIVKKTQISTMVY